MTEAFSNLGIEVRFEGKGLEEKGYDAATGRLLVDVDPAFYRPAEVEYLWGDASKAKRQLGWEREVKFEELTAMMMDADMLQIAGMDCETYRQKQKEAAC